MRILISVLFLLIFFSACQFIGGRRVHGNGNAGSESRNVSSFSGVRVVGGMDVELSSGSAYAVKVEADENLLKYILTKQDGNTLVIRPRQGYNLQPRTGMKVYVTAPALEDVSITGSGSVTSGGKLSGNRKLDIQVTGSGDVKLDVDAPEVAAEATGSGNIILAGTTKNFNAEITGSGEVRCFNLLSETTDVDISGSGSAEVFASKQLNIEINGSGDVAYKGTPAIRQNIAGSGGVHQVQ